MFIALLVATTVRFGQRDYLRSRLAAQQEAERSKVETRFRNLLEAAPDAMIMADGHGRIQLLNAAAERTFGYPRESLLQRPIQDLVPHGLHVQDVDSRAEFEQSRATPPTGADREQMAVHQNGSTFPVEVNLSPLDTQDGFLVIAAIRDISDRKDTEQALRTYRHELERSNAELQQFAYVASHDLQEPLRMVSSYTQLLARRYQGKLDEDADEFISYAVDGASRMQRLINDLLSYSRLGSKEIQLEDIDMGEVVQKALESLRHTIESTGAEITYENLPRVQADGKQMQQLLQNLISNALKFRSVDAPRIRIEAQCKASHWLFHIRDNGIGIEPKYFGRLFVIFQRLHGQGQYSGTGIGLALCKKIVERHDGRIWVESEPPTSGSTFFFTIPHRSETEYAA